MKTTLKHGSFTGLAKHYSAYRPSYNKSVLKGLSNLLNCSISEAALADIGAGTGIWTRLLASQNPKTLIAIEPNDDMRYQGEKDSAGTIIQWKKGDGENTTIESNSLDMVSMASSFHWVNFEQGCKEFHRILKKEGRFVALWNPRDIEKNSLLGEIEDYLYKLKPDLKRVSSGRSGLVEVLTSKLYSSGFFTDVVYMEGRDLVKITPEAYIGAWRSVNDVQFQLGGEKFEEFISFATSILKNYESIEIPYLTRAWSAQKVA